MGNLGNELKFSIADGEKNGRTRLTGLGYGNHPHQIPVGNKDTVGAFPRWR